MAAGPVREPATTAAVPRHPPPSGTQSIERVEGMLRVVASRGRDGMRLGDVASATGLPVSTCHRMLQCLDAEGLLERPALTRKHVLDLLFFLLNPFLVLLLIFHFISKVSYF